MRVQCANNCSLLLLTQTVVNIHTYAATWKYNWYITERKAIALVIKIREIVDLRWIYGTVKFMYFIYLCIYLECVFICWGAILKQFLEQLHLIFIMNVYLFVGMVYKNLPRFLQILNIIYLSNIFEILSKYKQEMHFYA